jgi:hypothetical protein
MESTKKYRSRTQIVALRQEGATAGSLLFKMDKALQNHGVVFEEADESLTSQIRILG